MGVGGCSGVWADSPGAEGLGPVRSYHWHPSFANSASIKGLGPQGVLREAPEWHPWCPAADFCYVRSLCLPSGLETRKS